MKLLVYFSLFTLVILSSCGKNRDSSGSEDDDDSHDAVNSRRIINATELSAGDICPTGGTLIKVGIDFNNNNQIDEGDDVSELQESYPVCNGTDGEDGSDLLVETEQPGENCSEGGVAIYDDDNLIGYICNGASGIEDAVLILSEDIASGLDSECTYGGAKIIWGVDQEPFDGILQPEEITDELVGCNTVPRICSENIVLRTDEELLMLSDCIGVFEGDLVIDGPFTSLDSLGQISYISGKLELKKSNISDFSSFSNLEFIGGDFVIEASNGDLTSFAGLENLIDVRGTMKIGALVGPEDFQSLESLTKLGALELDQNANQLSFRGLNGLTHLKMPALGFRIESLEGLENLISWDIDSLRFGNGGNIKIDDLTPLKNLEVLGDIGFNQGSLIANEDLVHLANIEEIGSIYVNGSSGITDISPIRPKKINGSFILSGAGSAILGLTEFFIDIKDVPGNLQITGVNNITDFNFLRRVESIGGSLKIGSNPLIKNFKGFSMLKSIGGRVLDNGLPRVIMDISFFTPETLCGLTMLDEFHSAIAHRSGWTEDWVQFLQLPQPACE